MIFLKKSTNNDKLRPPPPTVGRKNARIIELYEYFEFYNKT